MKRNLILLILSAFALGWCGTLNAQEKELKKRMKEADPKVIGARIVNKFLVTPHTRFGNPRAEKAPNYLTYPDACTWLGALWFSQAVKDREMQQRLKDRFEPLFTTEKNMLPRMNHVDHNVVGAVPLEIYMQKLGDRKYYDLGMKYADTQWEVPADAKPEQKEYAEQGYSWQTRVWIDDMFMITTVQSQAFLATGDRKYIDRAAAEMVMYLEKIQRPNRLFYHAPTAPL
ncbi:MAG: glycoside hydrolase family 88 protein, partial [Bacteroides sp.]|nr:glycoside hydrolase family 88 protein [Bacteroides sp.]